MKLNLMFIGIHSTCASRFILELFSCGSLKFYSDQFFKTRCGVGENRYSPVVEAMASGSNPDIVKVG
jgi:hypothetical protein